MHLLPRFAAFVLALYAMALEAAGHGQVFVVGSLYQRHDSVPAYDLKALAALIEAIQPQVLVLDVSPAELAKKKVWPGKIEYVQVIFPYIERHGLKAYAGEPAEPLFSEISKGVGQARQQLAIDKPAAAAAMEQSRKATYAALSAYWKSPADVHDATTERIVVGLKSVEEALVGEIERRGSQRWDAHAAAIARQAVRENPGKRILQITGLENLPRVRAELRASSGIELVDMAEWIKANAVRVSP